MNRRLLSEVLMKRGLEGETVVDRPDGRRRRSSRGTLRKSQEIDHVRVEETFPLKEPASRGSKKVGEACYVSATINNRRYYGLLVDQDALKTSSMFYFQDTANGLELNRRMKLMKQRQTANQPPTQEEKPLEEPSHQTVVEPDGQADTSCSQNALPPAIDVAASSSGCRQVEKFRYVEDSNGKNSDFRILLATFAHVQAASEDDENRRQAIEAACQAGGDFVGNYYYQYQAPATCLETDEVGSHGMGDRGLRMSMGFNIFLQNTFFPEWFPLANLEIGQHQVLDTLGMKKDGGILTWDESKKPAQELALSDFKQVLPMEPRSRYRVVVVGGGIAGLSCCLELLQLSQREGLDIEVTLVEGRSRLGGRLWTDRETFKAADLKTSFPVDLGASWIHGIDSNPLAIMAREANVDFVRTSEEVTMLLEGGDVVDQTRDERAGELFDQFLDLAVEDCWQDTTGMGEGTGGRAAARWYASGFNPTVSCTDSDMGSSVNCGEPLKTPAGRHRDSSDVSVDEAIGKIITNGRLKQVAGLSEEERRMLFWNVKNIEYALGANVSDLSMKFWDIDERHAFDGDHVMLKQGYSSVVDHIHMKLKEFGTRFTCLLDSPVERIEYSRKTITNPYFCPSQRHKRFVELSDTCQIVLERDGSTIPCDFVVCAVPLGVLKNSVQSNTENSCSRLVFEPSLPFSKTDAIQSVGFGLLDKVFLQFPEAFWRGGSVLKQGQTVFGNASACNPQYYMFIDVGLSIEKLEDSSPPILMTLISGREAALSECLSEDELVADVVQTLAILFEGRKIPNPTTYKVTRWGRDRFSRGSYSFLGPGTTDQDFRLLQTPINGNGDSILLDASETMRLFFAGEHTTSLYPSMAHGAMLSGYRAAKEVYDAFAVSASEEVDKVIPLALFRHMNPKGRPTCALCRQSGSRMREGSLLAFKRGAREVVVHNNCAEYSPEVGIKDGLWNNVIRACNRGKAIECSLCGQVGATIGCSLESCRRSYHFSCAEDTGWNFDEDGKAFGCDLHRTPIGTTRKISLEYWLMSSEDGSSLRCCLCDVSNERDAGELLAFQKGTTRVVVHEHCARFTTTIKIAEKASSRFENDFENIFEAVASARTCERCSRGGATIECAESSCRKCYHFACGQSLDWDFRSNKLFLCLSHRDSGSSNCVDSRDRNPGQGFKHALFSLSGSSLSKDTPANLVDARDAVNNTGREDLSAAVADASQFKLEKLGSYNGEVVDLRLVRVTRESQKHNWNLTLEASVDPTSGTCLLLVSQIESISADGLRCGDLICTLNGTEVGKPALDSIEKVLKVLSEEVEIAMEVCVGPVQDGFLEI